MMAWGGIRRHPGASCCWIRRPGVCSVAPLAVAHGAMGLWAALEVVFPDNRGQRCWCHEMGNVLNAPPQALPGKAKAALQEIWRAQKRTGPLTAWCGTTEPSIRRLWKTQQRHDALLGFYDIQIAHRVHLRTIPTPSKSR